MFEDTKSIQLTQEQQKQLQAFTDRANVLRGTIDVSSERIRVLKGENLQLEMDNGSLTEKKSTLKADIDYLEAKKIGLEKQIEENNKTLSQQAQTHQSISEQIAQNHTELDAKKTNIEKQEQSLKQEIANFETKKQNLEKECLEIESKKQLLQSALKQL